MTKHNMQMFRNKPLFQAAKQFNGEKWDVGYLPAFGWTVFFCCFDVQCLQLRSKAYFCCINMCDVRSRWYVC